MTNGILDGVLAWVQARLGSFFGPIFEYLFIINWYLGLGVFFVLLLVIGYFLPFKWTRAALGFLFLLAAAFVAGGQVMWSHMMKVTPPPPSPPPPRKRRDWEW